jgi:hypothetical protein
VDSVPVDSVPVIPWPFRNPPEFRGTEIPILAGTTAKIRFRGIPGINRIPPDSGRNTRRTVKNSMDERAEAKMLRVYYEVSTVSYTIAHTRKAIESETHELTQNEFNIRNHTVLQLKRGS